jgi:uncharacterized protein (TIGR04255 family)
MPSADEFFPNSERVLYGRNPLNEVICQVRFPSILKIESDPPSDFQEKIRDRFPLLERASTALSGKVPAEILRAIGAPAPTGTYSFIAEDRNSQANLTSESLAIATSSYTRWEDFQADVTLALRSLEQTYRPSFYSRVGLRYQNVISRSDLGLDVGWADLLRPEIAAELTIPVWAERVETMRKAIRCRINEIGDHFIIQHGLAEVEDSDELHYMLDFDYYVEEKTEIGNVGAVIDRLHGHSGKAFRWAISQTLHDAMEPQQW